MSPALHVGATVRACRSTMNAGKIGTIVDGPDAVGSWCVKFGALDWWCDSAEIEVIGAITGDSLAVMKLAARLRSTAAALVAHGANRADLASELDDLERDMPALLAAVRGEVQP